MKKTFLFLLISTALFSCGGEKNNSDTAQQDSTAVDSTLTDTSNLEQSDDAVSPHPVSDWAQRAANTDFYSPSVDELVSKKAVYTPNDDEAMDYTHDHLNKTELSRLTTKELIYYCLKYPCSFSQICAADDFQDSTHTPKISGHLPFDYSGAMMSEWQSKAIEKRRDSVIVLLNEHIKQHPDKIENEYLGLLLQLKAVESIPVIIKTASDENLANYTFLAALMMENKYAPFEETGMYQRFYGDNSWNYGSRIEATKANLDSIKTLATQMHKEWK